MSVTGTCFTAIYTRRMTDGEVAITHCCTFINSSLTGFASLLDSPAVPNPIHVDDSS